MSDAFSSHSPVHVVRSEIQRYRGNFFGQHDPIGFDVRKVVQDEARDSDHFQVVNCRRKPVSRFDARVPGLESKRYKGQESTRFVLGLAELYHMHDPFFNRLDVAVQNRAVRGYPHSMSELVNFKPGLHAYFGTVKLSSDPLRKNLRPAPRHCSKSCFLQLPKHFIERHFEFLMEKIDFDSSKCLDVEVRKILANLTQHFEVIFPLPIRM